MTFINDKYPSSRSFRQKTPQFNWQGLIAFLVFVLTIVGMFIYKAYFD